VSETRRGKLVVEPSQGRNEKSLVKKRVERFGRYIRFSSGERNLGLQLGRTVVNGLKKKEEKVSVGSALGGRILYASQ